MIPFLYRHVQRGLCELHDCLLVPTDARPAQSEATERAIAQLSRTNRSVSRFWVEKATLVLDALQIYGLMWQLSQPWPWPSSWLVSTRWTVVFNLDVLSFLPTGAGMGMQAPPYSLWGELKSQYWLYALLFALLPWLAAGWYFFQLKAWRARGNATYLAQAAKLENNLLWLFQALYLPIGLAVSRLFNCMRVPNPLDVHAYDHVLSVDPSVACHESAHVLMGVGIGCVLGVPFLVSFPILLYQRIHHAGTSFDPDAHEVYVQATELSFLVGISDDYYLMYVAQHASFVQRMRALPVIMCTLKLVLLGVFAFLRSEFPSVRNQALQGMLFFVVVTFALLHRCYHRPFRLATTNHLMIFLDFVVVFDAVMVLLSAANVRSALTVASMKVLCLRFMHSWAVIILCGWLFVMYLGWRHMKLVWPTHFRMHAVLAHGPVVLKWVNTAKAAQKLMHKAWEHPSLDYASPALVRPTAELGEVAATLQTYAKEAFDIHHLLHGTLYDLANQVQAVHIDALATSATPSAMIDDCVQSFTLELQKYKQNHALIHPSKRDALFNLHELHTLVDEHDHRYRPIVSDSQALLPRKHEEVVVAGDPQLYVWTPWDPSELFGPAQDPSAPSLLPVLWYLRVQHKPTQTSCIGTVTLVDLVAHRGFVEIPICTQTPEIRVVSGWAMLLLTRDDVHVHLLQCKDADTWDAFASLPRLPPPPAISPARIDQLYDMDDDSIGVKTAAWQHVLQDWEAAFVFTERRRPSVADRRKVAPWFRQYHKYRLAGMSSIK
ncbi:transmembrane protein [Achlya hypogyna]|uniref:Transmembrane protein n=1 Tax=Achlya hypogyna TaxID=1202772 RepID=A0A1V9YG50_ACHHY|nr:transmembrane protein [Achlya hypogyna]